MLSTQYRLRLEAICKKIVAGEEVSLDDMIWSNKLAKANTSAMQMLRLARRTALNPGDDFFNGLNLGDPDPSSHRSGFNSVDEIADWFKQDKPADWRQRD
tara:strand:+ start:3392 stop:3691 length:300 start_codon:yes stop_codon:yes gene_type:complete